MKSQILAASALRSLESFAQLAKPHHALGFNEDFRIVLQKRRTQGTIIPVFELFAKIPGMTQVALVLDEAGVAYLHENQRYIRMDKATLSPAQKTVLSHLVALAEKTLTVSYLTDAKPQFIE